MTDDSILAPEPLCNRSGSTLAPKAGQRAGLEDAPLGIDARLAIANGRMTEAEAREILTRGFRVSAAEAVRTVPNALPSTPAALRAECEKQRGYILAAAQRGQPFRQYTEENHDAAYVDAIKGDKYSTRGYLLPPLERLFLAATALDVPNVPPFLSEPQTGMQAIAALDGLLAAIAATESERPAITAKKQPKRRKAGRPVDTNVKQDKQIFDGWQTKSYSSYRELARAFSLTERQVRRAVDRERKRRAGKSS